MGEAKVGSKETSNKYCLANTLEKNPKALNVNSIDQHVVSGRDTQRHAPVTKTAAAVIATHHYCLPSEQPILFSLSKPPSAPRFPPSPSATARRPVLP